MVLGVSPDSVQSHQKWRAKLHLPFELVADTDHKIAEAYGVWVVKLNYGKKYWGVARTTFIIGPDGTIQRVFEKVKPDGHADEVRTAIEELQQKGK